MAYGSYTSTFIKNDPNLNFSAAGWSCEMPKPSSSMFLINNAKNSYEFTKDNTIHQIYEDSCEISKELTCEYIFSNFTNKKILLLVPGFTSKAIQVEDAVQKIASQVSESYDAVIGYVYPSGEKPWYIAARRLAKVAAEKLKQILVNISANSSKLDVAAHSMGTYVIFNTLNTRFTKTNHYCEPVYFQPVGNVFILGGADTKEIFYDCTEVGCTPYPLALRNVSTLYNFYTCSDGALPYHTLSIGQDTAGYPTHLNVSKLSERVKLIDASKEVDDHSGFHESDTVLKLINSIAIGRLSLPKNSYQIDGNFICELSQPVRCKITWQHHIDKFFKSLNI